jgi:outer membrane protein OmpA-like peptidoglycan-associated protein
MTEAAALPRRHLLRALPATALLAPALVMGLAGCTAEPPPARTFVVFFDPLSAEPDADANTILARAADAARAFPSEPVWVIGFADPEGSSEENRRLSQARAEAVSAHLAQRGVAASRIRRAARGATEPTLALVESRRVEIRIGAPPASGPTPPYRG